MSSLKRPEDFCRFRSRSTNGATRPPLESALSRRLWGNLLQRWGHSRLASRLARCEVPPSSLGPRPLERSLRSRRRRDTPLSPNRIGLRQSRLSLTLSRVSLSQSRVGLSQSGMSLRLGDTSLSQSRIALRLRDTSLSQSGMSLSQSGMSLRLRDTSPSQSRIGLSQSRPSQGPRDAWLRLWRVPLGRRFAPPRRRYDCLCERDENERHTRMQHGASCGVTKPGDVRPRRPRCLLCSQAHSPTHDR